MKPAPFDYADPRSLDEALELLAGHGDDATIIAGGQSLVPLLNLRLATPELIVDLRHIDELTEAAFGPDGLRCGAMARAADLEEHPSTRTMPGLGQALGQIGHSQIRARTTVGGSLAHADPAAELPALLVALDGTVTLRSRARGERTLAASDFLVGPLMTSREPDEVVTSVYLPRHRGRVMVDEVASRPGDFAIVGAVVAADTGAGVITDPRIAVFGAGGTAARLSAAERVVDGAAPGPDVAAEAGVAVMDAVDPVGDSHGSADYRRHLAGSLVERAIMNNLAAIR